MSRPRIVYRYGRSEFRDFETGRRREWLLTNGIGGFANSNIHGNSNRIFSGYLIASLQPPVDRMLILAKTHEELVIENVSYDLATQEYPGWKREGYRYQNSFLLDIVPEYFYQVGGITIRKRIALEYGKNTVALTYELESAGETAELSITPLFDFRPFGEVSTREQLQFECRVNAAKGELLLIPEHAREYQIRFLTSEGSFYDRKQKPVSMATPNYLIEENELYGTDVANGFTGVDQHATPYELKISLASGEKKKICLLCEVEKLPCEKTVKSTEQSEMADAAKTVFSRVCDIFDRCESRAEQLLEQAGVTDELTGRLVLSADHFLVHRASTERMTVLAGYPWFADWGRDTMIAFTGLTLAAGRFEDAASVLDSFACYVSSGMIPNVFPNNAKEEPMYNTIDASLWYFYAVYQYLQYTSGHHWSADSTEPLTKEEQFICERIYPALTEILDSYQYGKARYHIHMAEDGLICGGSDLDQLTWMDVRVGNVVVTPRHGKAVEINALWYNALKCMELFSKRFSQGNGAECAALAERVRRSFSKKFWNAELECLYDTISEEDVPDAALRPNQIFAVSLPFTMLSAEQEKRIVQKVYEKLYTPYGLRSLAADEPGYRAAYRGKLIERDMAYHMGTAWGYLFGAFVDAWVKTGGSRAAAKEMCLCFRDHMADGCLGGIAEVFDGEFACDSRGCYSQAWSVGEVLRVWRELNQCTDTLNS